MGARLLAGALLVLLTAGEAAAQERVVTAAAERRLAAAAGAPASLWVFFRADAVATIVAPPALSRAALERRAALGIPAFDNDVPLPDRWADALSAAGARVRHRSRWLRAISVDADEAAVRRIAALPEVLRIQPVASAARRPLPADAPLRPAHDPAAQPEAAGVLMLDDAFAEIGVELAHELGFSGVGVRVAVFDTGFDLEHPALRDLAVFATWDFISNDSVVSFQAGDPTNTETHGTIVWSVAGGDEPGVFRGVAYRAQFALARVEDIASETREEEDRWVAAIEWADSIGARVVNSSLGYRSFDDGFAWTFDDLDGGTTPATIAANEAAARGIVVATAQGNAGPGRGTLVAPADAFGALAVGAVDSLDFPSSFTSHGPTGDGRIKPDVAARGRNLPSARPGGGYLPASGTSLATPLIAGAVALLLEAWPQLSAEEVASLLKETGSRALRPDTVLGWGRPDFAAAILYPRLVTVDIEGLDQDGRLRDPAPTLTWHVDAHALARPARFIVEFAREPLFAVVTQADTVFGHATQLTRTRPLPPTGATWWRVAVEDSAGVRRASMPAGPFHVGDVLAATDVVLHQNFPNPFPRPELGALETRIWFDLGSRMPVHLAVYDLRGRLVRTLVPHRLGGCAGGTVTLDEGAHGRVGDADPCVLTSWDGRDDSGRVAAAGVYVLRLRAGGRGETRRVVWLP